MGWPFFDEIRKRWPDIYEARGMNPDYPIPGAETPLHLVTLSQAIHKILRSSEGDIAVVAHTDVISFIYGCFDPELSA